MVEKNSIKTFKKFLFESAVKSIPFKYREKFKKKIFYGKIKFCPVCDSEIKKFYTYYFPPNIKIGPRPDAVCPVCGSIERERLLLLYLEKCTDLFNRPKKKLLHIAPEIVLADRIKKNEFIEYLSADLDPKRAMIYMDLTDIKMHDNIFDVIICNHVFEHIPDHKKAMQEIYRILKPKGWAILQVPILGEYTFEDSKAITPEDREKIYGFAEHVRGYGKDYKDFLTGTGFIVKVDDFAKKIGDKAIRYMGLPENEDIYFCTKVF